MMLDDVLFNEVLLVKAPLSWTGSFLDGDKSDLESPSSAVDDAVGLLLAEVAELADTGLSSRGFVFLDVESRLRMLASDADQNLGVDVDVFVAAAKAEMTRIVPAMAVLLGKAELSVWLSVYARIAHRISPSRRVDLFRTVASDGRSVGSWGVQIGANNMLKRLARFVGLDRGLSASDVAMAVVSTFQDLTVAMAADVEPARVAEIVRMADSLVKSVENRTSHRFLEECQGFVGREASVVNVFPALKDGDFLSGVRPQGRLPPDEIRASPGRQPAPSTLAAFRPVEC